MRKLLILIIGFASVLNINAQVLNKKGEKVIRRVETYLSDGETFCYEILFNYNESLDLEEVVVNYPNVKKILWKKKGNTIERTQYKSDGKIDGVYDVRYKVEGGLIRKRTEDVHGIDGFVKRKIVSFQYNDERQMTSIREFDYNKEKGDDFGEESWRHMEIFEWDYDGNVYTSGSIGWNWREGNTVDRMPINYKDRKYYVSLLNDTNIDLTKLCLWNTRIETIEEVSEWFGKHSTFIMEEDYPFCYEFSRDDKGNVVRVDIYNRRITSKVRKREIVMKFYYWE